VRHWNRYRELGPGIIEYVYQLKADQQQNIASGVAPKAKSETGLVEGDFDLFERRHAGLQQLKNFIVNTIQMVVCRLNGQQVPPDRIQVRIIDAWYHITNEGGFHDAHGHGQCSWCGIFYLQLGDYQKATGSGAPNGGNRFYSPFNAGGAYLDYGNHYLQATYIDPPIEEGMLLLFPSYLLHSALPYRGKRDRIVIAFNSQSTLDLESHPT
jgi:uncharacterized protein (TIGR02466 family)